MSGIKLFHPHLLWPLEVSLCQIISQTLVFHQTIQFNTCQLLVICKVPIHARINYQLWFLGKVIFKLEFQDRIWGQLVYLGKLGYGVRTPCKLGCQDISFQPSQKLSYQGRIICQVFINRFHLSSQGRIIHTRFWYRILHLHFWGRTLYLRFWDRILRLRFWDRILYQVNSCWKILDLLWSILHPIIYLHTTPFHRVYQRILWD